jgi:hypothetical protein
MRSIFLILLLACDWAGDPYGGTCPWSRCWSSQEMFCHSTVYREQLRTATVPDLGPHFFAVPGVEEGDPPILLSYPPQGQADSFSAKAPRIYILMSIRR